MIQIIKVVILVLLGAGLAVLYIKKAKRVNKLVLRLIIVVTVMLVTVAGTFPAEAGLLTFSTPQKAYHYKHIAKISAIVEGENSAFLLLHERRSDTQAIIPKEGQRYKVDRQYGYIWKSDYFPNTLPNTLISIDIFAVPGTGDYYVTVTQTPLTVDYKYVTVKDSRDSQFEFFDEKVNYRINKIDLAYVKGPLTDYQLILGDEVFPIDWENMRVIGRLF